MGTFPEIFFYLQKLPGSAGVQGIKISTSEFRSNADKVASRAGIGTQPGGVRGLARCEMGKRTSGGVGRAPSLFLLPKPWGESAYPKDLDLNFVGV